MVASDGLKESPQVGGRPSKGIEHDQTSSMHSKTLPGAVGRSTISIEPTSGLWILTRESETAPTTMIVQLPVIA